MRGTLVKKAALVAAAAVIVIFGAIQLVPYGRSHSNPPVLAEPAWDSARTRTLAVRACFDCHSNETRWPWYSNIAPVSWLVQNHVDSGRRVLNFSEWGRSHGEGDEAVEAVAEGGMPPSYYTFINRTARLSSGELQELRQGLAATLGGGEGVERGRGEAGETGERERDDD